MLNEHWFVLASTVTSCFSISVFVSLVVVPSGITSSAVGLKICLITTVIKKCKSVSQLSRKKSMKNCVPKKS